MRRLQLTQKPDEQGALLSAVPSLRSVSGGSCALVRALLTALRFCKTSVSWDELMCLTGIAFLTPVTVEISRDAGDTQRCSGLADGLAVFGFMSQWHYPLATEQIVTLVKQSVEAQCPVLILGWPRETDDWGLLTGYDPARGVVCGWPAQDEPDGGYLGTKPGGVAAVTLTHDGKTLDREIAFIDALHRINKRADEVQVGWACWHEALLSANNLHHDDWQMLILRHRVALDDLADARMSAGTWLREQGENLTGEAGEVLYEAAELCLELANKAEVAEFGQVSDAEEFDNQTAQEQEKLTFEMSLLSKIDEEIFTRIRLAIRALDEGY